MKNPLTIIWLLILVIALVLIAAFAYIRFGANAQQGGGVELPFLKGSGQADNVKYTGTDTPYKALIAKNREFAVADALIRENKPLDAIPHYQNALAAATDTIQEAQIKFKIGLAYVLAKDYTNAIARYKEIAANKNYYSIVRAYSVEGLADILKTSSSPALRDLIYADEPYASLVVAGDPLLTDRKLFEYAVSIYPVGLSEAYIAGWYVSKLEASFFSAKPLLTTEQSAQYVEAAQKALSALDTDIARIQNDSNLTEHVARLYMAKGLVTRGLARVGAVSPEVPEQDFKRALQIYATLSNKSYDGFTRFNYAKYLNQLYGEKRVADIKVILAPFYTSDAYTDSVVSLYFVGEKENQLGGKADLARLAAIDSGFKGYLKSLGWVESDFKTTK